MPREYTILIRSVNKIIDAVKSVGVEPQDLYRAVNFDPALLSNPDNRIPFSQLVAFYEHGARLTGDDAFGLHIGERVKPELFDVLGYVVINSPTFGEAIDRLIRYHSIWSDGAFYRLEISGPRAHLTYEYIDELIDERRHDSEMTLSILVSFARRGTGVDWTPHEVSFQHSKPPNIIEHQRIFRSQVHFDRPINELIFDSSVTRSEDDESRPRFMPDTRSPCSGAAFKTPARRQSYQPGSSTSWRGAQCWRRSED